MRKVIFKFTPIIFWMVLAMSYQLWITGFALLMVVLVLVGLEIKDVIANEEEIWGWRAADYQGLRPENKER